MVAEISSIKVIFQILKRLLHDTCAKIVNKILIEDISATTWSNLMKFFLFEFYRSVEWNKKIFIKFDQVVAEVSSIKVVMKILVQFFVIGVLKFENNFNRRYLSYHLIKFNEIFFIWILQICRIQIKNFSSNLIK